MKKTGGKSSIEKELNISMRLLMLVLLLPAIGSLVILAFYIYSFQQSALLMNGVAELKPVVEDEIPEQVWSVVAGMNSFENCGVYDTIRMVDDQLDQYMEQNDSSQLLVARRTMDTLESYVQQIEIDMSNKKTPVSSSERMLEEVRSVASLTGDMLEDFVDAEIMRVSERNTRLRHIAEIMLAAGIILLVCSFFIARRTRTDLIWLIRESIDRLRTFTKDLASGDFQARAKPARVEEMSDLTEDVNVMAAQMGNLIEQNRKEQENLKKAELRTLQAQINPHFLYNTLDTIVWAAESGKDREVVDLTKSLSDFFRSSLSSGEDWVTVEQEIRHLTGYLSIQKTRYRDILSYDVQIEEGMGQYYILKLLLQPLAENALYHGIKYKRGGGRILVRGRLEDGFLCFSVQDTGVGMSEERLKEVLSDMKNGTVRPSGHIAEPGGGFGLYNVDQRIRLYYGQESGLQIVSSGEGTTVSFRVPARPAQDKSLPGFG